MGKLLNNRRHRKEDESELPTLRGRLERLFGSLGPKAKLMLGDIRRASGVIHPFDSRIRNLGRAHFSEIS